jgi:hypothetical protein
MIKILCFVVALTLRYSNAWNVNDYILNSTRTGSTPTSWGMTRNPKPSPTLTRSDPPVVKPSNILSFTKKPSLVLTSTESPEEQTWSIAPTAKPSKVPTRSQIPSYSPTVINLVSANYFVQLELEVQELNDIQIQAFEDATSVWIEMIGGSSGKLTNVATSVIKQEAVNITSVQNNTTRYLEKSDFIPAVRLKFSISATYIGIDNQFSLFDELDPKFQERNSEWIRRLARENTVFGTPAPSLSPTEMPTDTPSNTPSKTPTFAPTITPVPTVSPSSQPSDTPTRVQSSEPSLNPSSSFAPSESPSRAPSDIPSSSPTRSMAPTAKPSIVPTRSQIPSYSPTVINIVSANYFVQLELKVQELNGVQVQAFEDATSAWIEMIDGSSGKLTNVETSIIKQEAVNITSVQNNTARYLEKSDFIPAVQLKFAISATYIGIDNQFSLFDELDPKFQERNSEWIRRLASENTVFEPLQPPVTSSAVSSGQDGTTENSGMAPMGMATLSLVAVGAVLLGVIASVYSVRHYKMALYGEELRSPVQSSDDVDDNDDRIISSHTGTMDVDERQGKIRIAIKSLEQKPTIKYARENSPPSPNTLERGVESDFFHHAAMGNQHIPYASQNSNGAYPHNIQHFQQNTYPGLSRNFAKDPPSAESEISFVMRQDPHQIDQQVRRNSFQYLQTLSKKLTLMNPVSFSYDRLICRLTLQILPGEG